MSNIQYLKTINVKTSTGKGEYDVKFFSEVSNLNTYLKEALSSLSSYLIIVDSYIYNYYFLKGKLFDVSDSSKILVLNATEDEKTFSGVNKILDFLQSNQANRNTKIFAFGGGIIQDLVSFCAHIYFRGIDWVFIPTTLLSMSDSCLGAKSSINYGGFKNQLGAFHSPEEIIICAEFIKTLEEQEILSGLGEVFKFHLIKDQCRGFTMFESIFMNLNLGSRLDNQLAINLIYESLNLKKQYIEIDEFDKGPRKILNFGHTAGHALESVAGMYIPHGIAVTWGIAFANYLSFKLGKMDESPMSKINKFIFDNFLDTSVLEYLKDLQLSRNIFEAIKKDKKVTDNKIQMVLMNTNSLDFKLMNLDEQFHKLIYDFMQINY